jgi:hypothetical protein
LRGSTPCGAARLLTSVFRAQNAPISRTER